MAETGIQGAVKNALKALPDAERDDLEEHVAQLRGAIWKSKVRKALVAIHQAAEKEDAEALDEAMVQLEDEFYGGE